MAVDAPVKNNDARTEEMRDLLAEHAKITTAEKKEITELVQNQAASKMPFYKLLLDIHGGDIKKLEKIPVLGGIFSALLAVQGFVSFWLTGKSPIQSKGSEQKSGQEGRDVLAETGRILERLPVRSSAIVKKLDPHSFDQPRGNRKHKSIDIAVPSGEPVYAAFPATVTNIVPVQRGVNSIVYLTDSSGKTVVKYIHLSKIHVKVGDKVTKDTVVGLSGGIPGTPGAGTSQGAHLHMEIIHNGVHTNPYQHLVNCSDCTPNLKA